MDKYNQLSLFDSMELLESGSSSHTKLNMSQLTEFEDLNVAPACKGAIVLEFTNPNKQSSQKKLEIDGELLKRLLRKAKYFT